MGTKDGGGRVMRPADDEDPFAPLQRAMAKKAEEISRQGDPLTYMISRVAEIEDELDRRGADPLLKELEGLKKNIKVLMVDRGVDEAFDEVSEYEAVLQHRTSEMWDVAALKALLSPAQRRRYIVVEERVDVAAVADGAKNGDLSRAELEYKGAVTKVPGSKALYVRKRRAGAQPEWGQ